MRLVAATVILVIHHRDSGLLLTPVDNCMNSCKQASRQPRFLILKAICALGRVDDR